MIFISVIILWGVQDKYPYLFKLTCIQFIISIIFHFESCPRNWVYNVKLFDMFICGIYFSYVGYLSYNETVSIIV